MRRQGTGFATVFVQGGQSRRKIGRLIFNLAFGNDIASGIRQEDAFIDQQNRDLIDNRIGHPPVGA